ncbi:MAG TPA: WYL domain-containing protein [Clostridiales bacterium]|nr:WYL domain-containing protein [Clostridiales bacterium]
MDAVYSFRFLPPKHTEDLVEKLQQVLSVYERKRFKHLTITRPGLKTLNRQVLWNIEQLDEAISKKVKVRFSYLHYDLDKKLVPRREEKYTVNPYGMVINNENYYLICVKENKDNISMYRIDRISGIEITDCALDSWDFEFSPKVVTEHAVYAYTGKPELITMICRRSILDHVIDKFGLDIHIRNIGSEKLEISFTVSPDGVKFWALQYLPHVEVVSPQWLRDEIIECLKSNPYLKI